MMKATSVVSFVVRVDAFLELFRVAVDEFRFGAKVELVGGVLTWVGGGVGWGGVGRGGERCAQLCVAW